MPLESSRRVRIVRYSNALAKSETISGCELSGRHAIAWVKGVQGHDCAPNCVSSITEKSPIVKRGLLLVGLMLLSAVVGGVCHLGAVIHWVDKPLHIVVVD